MQAPAKFSGNVGAFNFWSPKLTQKLATFNVFYHPRARKIRVFGKPFSFSFWW
ncbi:hypothetical protein ATCC51561_1840 [Campylobacter concisus ATCC 51561]|nr:hypothetical protein ATCC51561_1840 [Campylobacter concisus ATCC 51561]